MEDLSVIRVDEKTYKFGNYEFNYSSYLENERIKIDKIADSYKFNEECLTLEERKDSISLDEKNKMEKLSEELDKNVELVNDFINLLNINEINILKLLESIYDKKFDNIFTCSEDLNKVGIKELIGTYTSVIHYDKYRVLIGNMEIETINYHSFLNSL